MKTSSRIATNQASLKHLLQW